MKSDWIFNVVLFLSLLVLFLWFTLPTQAETYNVSISWYTDAVSETDDTPNVNACGHKPVERDIAISRDLLKHGLKCGDKVQVIIDNNKTYNVYWSTVADVMGATSKYRGNQTMQIDIFTRNKTDALRNGRVQGVLIR